MKISPGTKQTHALSSRIICCGYVCVFVCVSLSVDLCVCVCVLVSLFWFLSVTLDMCVCVCVSKAHPHRGIEYRIVFVATDGFQFLCVALC